MPTQPTIARIWRGRTRAESADAYETYIKAEGIPPLEKTALGVQLSRRQLPMVVPGPHQERSRRWCDMAVCGNQAKTRKHRAFQCEGE